MGDRGNEGGREGDKRGLEDWRAGGNEGGLEDERAGGREGAIVDRLAGWPVGKGEAKERGLEGTREGEAGRQPATGSGTITLRVLKPDPMPAADQRGRWSLPAREHARGWGLAVSS